MKAFFQSLVVQFAFLFLYLLDLLGVQTGPQQPFNRAMRRQMGAVVTVKSTLITNRDAVPSVINKAFLARGRVHRAQALCSAANGDSIASIYKFVTIKSNDMVTRVELFNASLGAACTMDIGLYQTTVNGAAVVDADFFASAVDMNTAHLTPLDVTLEAAAGPATVANREKRVWEALGLTADPQIEYDVCGTLVAAAAAAGAMLVAVEVVAASG